jgi:FkbM family methyltransferase
MPFLVPYLKKSGRLGQINFTIAMVGSRKINDENDGTQGWSLLKPNLTIYGFDADPSTCQQMNQELEKQKVNWTEKHIPLALGNQVGTSTLYVTKFPACSSLYKPSQFYINRYLGNSELIQLVSTETIEMTTLDEFCKSEKITEIDFIQIDTQGAELQVIEGAVNILKQSTLAMKVEVEFTQIYENQPLFSDVDISLRNQGFTFFDFGMLYRDYRRRGPLISQEHQGQLIWTDAFYFRDLIQESNNNSFEDIPKKLLKLACIADILNFTDYALEVLEYLTWKYGNNSEYNFADFLVEILSESPDLVQQGLGSLSILKRIQTYIKTPSNLLKLSQSTENLLFNLRTINLVVFPDWSQPEHILSLELTKVIKIIETHPNRSQISLLIDNSNISDETASLILSSIVINLLMEEELDIDQGPEISLIGQLSPIQWQALVSYLTGRIKLNAENQEAIASVRAEIIPVYDLEH